MPILSFKRKGCLRFSLRSRGDQKILAVSKSKLALVDEVSDTYSNWLGKLWDHLAFHTHHKVDLKELAGLGIRFENLLLNDEKTHPQAIQTTYFTAKEKKELQAYEPDTSQLETRRLLRDFFGCWPPDDFIPAEFDREVEMEYAVCLCGTVDAAFGWVERKKSGDKRSKTFQELTEWKEIYFTEAFDHGPWSTSDFWCNSLLDSGPQNIWAAKEHPHIMATIAHGYPSDNSCLFLSEIRLIISLMIVRLINGSFPDHNIVPVMVLSFTGQQGRMLQAHMEKDCLVIRSSMFYDFSASQDAHLWDFLPYMVGDLHGTTRTLDVPQLKSGFTTVGASNQT